MFDSRSSVFTREEHDCLIMFYSSNYKVVWLQVLMKLLGMLREWEKKDILNLQKQLFHKILCDSFILILYFV